MSNPLCTKGKSVPKGTAVSSERMTADVNVFTSSPFHLWWPLGGRKAKMNVGAQWMWLAAGVFWGGRIWVRGLRYLSVHVNRLPGWSANSSFGITSNPVAERGFVPAPILTGCLLHYWVAFVVTTVLGLQPGFLEVYSASSVPPVITLLDSCLAIVFQLDAIQHWWHLSELRWSSLAQRGTNRITAPVWHFWQANANRGWSWCQEKVLGTCQS